MFVGTQNAIQEKQDRIRRGEEVLVKLRVLQREVIAREEDFAKIDAATPHDMALPGVYHDLQRIGSESGLALSNVGSQTTLLEKGDWSITKTNVVLDFEGSYNGVKNFLSQIASAARMFNAQSVGLQIADETTGTVRLQVDIEAYAAQPLEI